MLIDDGKIFHLHSFNLVLRSLFVYFATQFSISWIVLIRNILFVYTIIHFMALLPTFHPIFFFLSFILIYLITIHLISHFLSRRVTGELKRPLDEGRGTFWTGHQSITGPHRDKQPFTLTLCIFSVYFLVFSLYFLVSVFHSCMHFRFFNANEVSVFQNVS